MFLFILALLNWSEMKPKIRTNILTIFSVFIMLFALLPESKCQADISGAGLNIFARVDSVGVDVATHFVRIPTNPGFAVNDTILLIQMKGVGMFYSEDNLYGDGNELNGKYGWYESFVYEYMI